MKNIDQEKAEERSKMHERLHEIADRLKIMTMPPYPGELYDRMFRIRIKLTRERIEIMRKLEDL